MAKTAVGSSDPQDEGAAVMAARVQDNLDLISKQSAGSVSRLILDQLAATLNLEPYDKGFAASVASIYAQLALAESRSAPPAPPEEKAPTLVLGLGGLLRSGKDTVGDYLVQNYGFYILGFSEPLNDMLKVLDPIVEADLRYATLVDREGYVEAKTRPEIRRLLQVMGTEVGRNMIDQDLWVNLAKRRIMELSRSGFPVAITGVRFANELNMVRSIGGTTWWVNRGGEPDPGHASENSVTGADFDRVIDNLSTLDDLYLKLDGLMINAGLSKTV